MWIKGCFFCRYNTPPPLIRLPLTLFYPKGGIQIYLYFFTWRNSKLLITILYEFVIIFVVFPLVTFPQNVCERILLMPVDLSEEGGWNPPQTLFWNNVDKQKNVNISSGNLFWPFECWICLWFKNFNEIFLPLLARTLIFLIGQKQRFILQSLIFFRRN